MKISYLVITLGLLSAITANSLESGIKSQANIKKEFEPVEISKSILTQGLPLLTFRIISNTIYYHLLKDLSYLKKSTVYRIIAGSSTTT